MDIIIHCGDICVDGNLSEINDFFDWVAHLNISHKIFVHGNHDWPFELDPENSQDFVPRNVRWMQDESTEIEGITIRSINSLFMYAETISSDLLISHYPPKGILDAGFGMQEIADFVSKSKPKYHVFGHNHADFGTKQLNGITYINASVFHDC